MELTMDIVVLPIIIYVTYVLGKEVEKHGSIAKLITDLIDTDFDKPEKSAQKKTHATHIA